MDTHGQDLDEPLFGCPGFIAWARNLAHEHATSVVEGLPAGEVGVFAGRRGLRAALTMAGILSIPGTQHPPHNPGNTIYLQAVQAADLWADPEQAAHYERRMGVVLAVAFHSFGELYFDIAADRGGAELRDEWQGRNRMPKLRFDGPAHYPGSGPAQAAPTLATATPQFGQPGYMQWTLEQLEGSGIPVSESVPDDFPLDDDAVRVPRYDVAEFLKRASTSAARAIYALRLDAEDDELDVASPEEPEGPLLIAAFEHEPGAATFILAADHGREEFEEGVKIDDALASRAAAIAAEAMSRITIGVAPAPARPPSEMRRREAESNPARMVSTEELWDAACRYVDQYREWREGQIRVVDMPLDDLYFDFRSGVPVPIRHRPLVDSIIHDPGYGLDDNNLIARRYAGHLPEDEFEVVAAGADYTYRYSFEKVLVPYAIPFARDLANHPDIRLDNRGATFNAWVESQLPAGMDPRLARQVFIELHRCLSARTGEIRQQADIVYNRLDPALLDRIGFTTRIDARHQLLAGALAEFPETNGARRVAGDYIINRERFEGRELRERRYATAARKLQARGITAQSISIKLQISPTVLKRLLTTHRDDCQLEADDPLHAILEA